MTKKTDNNKILKLWWRVLIIIKVRIGCLHILTHGVTKDSFFCSLACWPIHPDPAPTRWSSYQQAFRTQLKNHSKYVEKSSPGQKQDNDFKIFQILYYHRMHTTSCVFSLHACMYLQLARPTNTINARYCMHASIRYQVLRSWDITLHTGSHPDRMCSCKSDMVFLAGLI